MKVLTRTFIALLGLALFSCDNKEVFVEELNEAPTITIDGDVVTSFVDSIKISVKSTEPSETYRVVVTDLDGNAGDLVTSVELGDLGISVSEVSENIYDVTISPNSFGTNQAGISVTDAIGASVTYTMDIIAFDNLAPIVAFEESDVKEDNSITNSGLHYIIDLARCYDADGHLGGGIEQYEVIVNNETIQREFAEIPYIFPSTGTYAIKVRVRDAEGTWSSQVTENVTIN